MRESREPIFCCLLMIARSQFISVAQITKLVSGSYATSWIFWALFHHIFVSVSLDMSIDYLRLFFDPPMSMLESSLRFLFRSRSLSSFRRSRSPLSRSFLLLLLPSLSLSDFLRSDLELLALPIRLHELIQS